VTAPSEVEPYFFVHIPKTAGTSFRIAVQQAFPKRVVYDYGKASPHTWEPIKSVYEGKLGLAQVAEALLSEGVVMLGGHVAFNKYADLFEPQRVLTILREPVSRVVSEYEHTRRQGFTGTLLEFANKPRNRNLQTRLLRGVALEEFGLVGLTERYNESIELLRGLTGWDVAALAMNRNPETKAAKAGYELSRQDLATLRKLNRLDVKLYAEACRIFDQRWASRGDAGSSSAGSAVSARTVVLARDVVFEPSAVLERSIVPMAKPRAGKAAPAKPERAADKSPDSTRSTPFAAKAGEAPRSRPSTSKPPSSAPRKVPSSPPSSKPRAAPAPESKRGQKSAAAAKRALRGESSATDEQPKKGAGSESKSEGLTARKAQRRAAMEAIRPKGEYARGPFPLVSLQHRLGLMFSPKAGCTFAVRWFFAQTKLLPAAEFYHPFVHRYRQRVFYTSEGYRPEHVADPSVRVVKFVRNPFDRAVSSYVHAVRRGYENARLAKFLGRPVGEGQGYSFREFVRYLGTLNLEGCDPHHRLQEHPLEREGLVRPTHVIKIEESRTSLPRLEQELGLPVSDFEYVLASHHHTTRDQTTGFCGDHPFLLGTEAGIVPENRWFYDAELRARVAELYRADFAACGYDPS
jgi:hypothetical protein